MNSRHVDFLVRSLPMSYSRRGALTALLGGSLGALGFIETAAKKKNK